jgi:probable phosphoglycerate mutase
MNDAVVAYIDGGARGNPGPAGFGVRIEQPDGTLVEEFHESIGTATNNVAEYRGLLAALEWAKARGCRTVHVRSDSLLLVQQMLGRYKVKNEGLQPLHAKARLLAHAIGKVTFEHVRREANRHADRLANAAMDGAAAPSRQPQPAPAREPHPALSHQPAPARTVEAAAGEAVAARAVEHASSDTPAGEFERTAAELREAIHAGAARMRGVSDIAAAIRPAAGKWSRKEILGHLIDSAANNHQRFIRAQEQQPLVFPAYDGASWVRTQHYAERGWNDLVVLWESYNRHLAHIIGRIPDALGGVECRIGGNDPVTLGFLARDYVAHLRHHLDQL